MIEEFIDAHDQPLIIPTIDEPNTNVIKQILKDMDLINDTLHIKNGKILSKLNREKIIQLANATKTNASSLISMPHDLQLCGGNINTINTQTQHITKIEQMNNINLEYLEKITSQNILLLKETEEIREWLVKEKEDKEKKERKIEEIRNLKKNEIQNKNQEQMNKIVEDVKKLVRPIQDMSSEMKSAISNSGLRRSDHRELAVGSPMKSNLPKRTYADTLTTPHYNLVIESNDPKHTGEEVVAQVKSKVDVVQLGIGVTEVRKLRNKKIIIGCGSEREREKFKKAVKEAAPNLTITEPKNRKPLLRLKGVAADLSDAKIEEAIVMQNSKLLDTLDLKQKKIKIIRRIKIRNSPMSNMIAEVDHGMWNMMKDQKIRIGYQIVPAVDQTPLVQCFKCLGFGHKAKDCDAALRCGRCAQSHDTRECDQTTKTPVCTNCKDRQNIETDHPAYSAQCPEWQKWDKIARSSVQYC